MEESSLELAARHADFLKLEPWHGLRPDEEAMRREEGPDEGSRRADVQELLFSFLLADGLGNWLAVGLRACGVMREICPGMLVGRDVPAEVVAGSFPAGELVARVRGDGPVMRRLLEFYFPPAKGQKWLREGVARVVLVARAFQPELVMVEDAPGHRRLPAFEDFAIAFGEMAADAGPRERGLARSRWSARAQNVLRRPIERAGGSVPALFGKSAMVRMKYQKAARGNGNRLNTGKARK